MNCYAKGRRFEYEVKKQLEKEGYYVIRAAGSHTKCDLVAFLAKDYIELPLVRAIQCKSGNSPYKKDLVALKKLKLPLIVQKEIWIKKPRQEVKVIIIR